MSASWIKASSRWAIYHRDGFACVYCGVTKAAGARLSLDHVTPRVRGGSHAATNLVTCCTACNVARGDLSLRRWVRALIDLSVPEEVAAAIPGRVATQTKKPLDRVAGRRLAAAVSDPTWGFSKYIRQPENDDED